MGEEHKQEKQEQIEEIQDEPENKVDYDGMDDDNHVILEMVVIILWLWW